MNLILGVALSVLALAAPGGAHELDRAVLEQIVGESRRTNSDALVVIHDGETVVDETFGKPVRKIEAMSATKSIVSLAIGLLVDRKLIDIDDPVSSLYPEWKQGRKRTITIRHLLTHTSGLQNVANAGTEVEVAPDAVQLALCAELETDPGTVYSYNNKATNLLAGIVEKTSGQKLDAFLTKHLFTPLGITDIAWRRDPAGNPLGMAGLQILPSDLARIGQMILAKGRWNGGQVVSEEWLRVSFSPQALREEHGFYWWLMFERQSMVIDDALLAKVAAKAGEDAVPLLARMKGKYPSFAAMQSHARSVYAAEEFALAQRSLAHVSPSEIRIENEGRVIGYAATGYLGQQLIILPEKNLVVVRMITTESHRQVPNNSDFPTLKRLATKL